jgi:hypothetical protein
MLPMHIATGLMRKSDYGKTRGVDNIDADLGAIIINPISEPSDKDSAVGYYTYDRPESCNLQQFELKGTCAVRERVIVEYNDETVALGD